MKTLNEVVIDHLPFYMGKLNLTQHVLAQKSGVLFPTIKSIMQRRTKGIALKTVIMLANGVDVTVSEFLDDESFHYENLELD